MIKYLNDGKTPAAINNKLFELQNCIIDNLNEVELAKAEVDHKEPCIVGFFILQYPELRMLELYYNFFKEFCNDDKYEELVMDTATVSWEELV